MYEIKNKVAVITGSGRGIGREIAIALSKNGSKVVVNVKKRVEDGLKTLEEVKKYSDGILVQSDVSNREGCEKLVSETISNFQGCDILINNAGISIASKFLESDDRLINKIFTTNVMSTIYCSQSFGKIMRNGVIINISSIAGLKPMKFLSIYGMSKAAIISLTKYLAVELAENNIRVNSIAPSVVKTVMGESLLNLLNMNDDEYANRYTLTKKIILPEDIAESVLFLIKNDSITGETLVIDSGQNIIDIFNR
ncbi:MAG: SDR family oxidoreductase [Thermoplasmata archaeon]|nr:SDR family oxidoreductase [Thermoplasmata archaeon]